MSGPRFESLRTGRADEQVTLASLCHDCLGLLPVDGVSVALLASDRRVASSASSNGTAPGLADLEATLGQGPALAAHDLARPVIIEDTAEGDGRWPEYAHAAHQAGVRSVCTVPLQLGAARLGVLTLLRARPGPFDDEDLSHAIAVADALIQVIVDLQADASSGSLTAALEDGAAFQAVVHQATGAIAARLGCGVDEALVRLRAAAFAEGRSLPETAAAVMAGELTIEET